MAKKKQVSSGSIKQKVEKVIDNLLDDALTGSVDLERLMAMQAIAKTAIDYLKITDKETEGVLLQDLMEESYEEESSD